VLAENLIVKTLFFQR